MKIQKNLSAIIWLVVALFSLLLVWLGGSVALDAIGQIAGGFAVFLVLGGVVYIRKNYRYGFETKKKPVTSLALLAVAVIIVLVFHLSARHLIWMLPTGFALGQWATFFPLFRLFGSVYYGLAAAGTHWEESSGHTGFNKTPYKDWLKRRMATLQKSGFSEKEADHRANLEWKHLGEISSALGRKFQERGVSPSAAGRAGLTEFIGGTFLLGENKSDLLDVAIGTPVVKDKANPEFDFVMKYYKEDKPKVIEDLLCMEPDSEWAGFIPMRPSLSEPQFSILRSAFSYMIRQGYIMSLMMHEPKENGFFKKSNIVNEKTFSDEWHGFCKNISKDPKDRHLEFPDYLKMAVGSHSLAVRERIDDHFPELWKLSEKDQEDMMVVIRGLYLKGLALGVVESKYR